MVRVGFFAGLLRAPTAASYHAAMRLSDHDLRLARDTRCFLTDIEQYDTPQKMYDFAVRELENMGYKLVPKRSTRISRRWRIKRFTTTWPRRIALGVNWKEKPLIDKAILLMHELVHAIQSRIYRSFYARYVTDKGFRFAVEAQAYRFGCRVYQILGGNRRQVYGMAARKAQSLRAYFPRRWRDDVEREGRRIMAMA